MKHDSKSKPSKWFLRFFRWYCNPNYVEDLEGDLLERFEQKTTKKYSVSEDGFHIRCTEIIQARDPTADDFAKE